MTTNADPDIHKYSCCFIGFDARRSFSLSDSSKFGKNVIIFGADMSSSVHFDNRKNYILILGKSSAQRLDHRTLTVEKNIFYKILSNIGNFVSVCIIMG